MSVRKSLLAALCAVAIPVGLSGCEEPLRANPGVVEFNQIAQTKETTFTNIDRTHDIPITEAHVEGTSAERFEVQNTGCMREESTVAKNGGTCILRIRLLILAAGNALVTLLVRRHKVGSVTLHP